MKPALFHGRLTLPFTLFPAVLERSAALLWRHDGSSSSGNATVRVLEDGANNGHGHHTDHPSVLVTTAYWKINSKRGPPEESDSVYSNCMANVLSLNVPMVVYGDATTLEEMRVARGTVSPGFVEEVKLEVEELSPCSRHPELWTNRPRYTNHGDVPSVDLGCIWDAKPSLLMASGHNHPNYDWYAWLDVCMGHGVIPFHHGENPWPQQERLEALPQNKIAVSLSNENACESCRANWTYCHCLAGTAFLVPKGLVDSLASKFSDKVDECLHAFSDKDEGAYVCLSDQVIMTKLYMDSPDMFAIGSSGYGAVATQQLSTSNIVVSRDMAGGNTNDDPHRCDGAKDGISGCRDCCGTNDFDDPCVESCMNYG